MDELKIDYAYLTLYYKFLWHPEVRLSVFVELTSAGPGGPRGAPRQWPPGGAADTGAQTCGPLQPAPSGGTLVMPG